ncbi:ribosomal large subunit pseudouridine synthase B [Alkalispirillum mobile]|uniref:Pseudouridine synthase n=1 Tax=Alkalispirillum mobile TaxID=85925 RepID=A0A498C2G1_9GAMM|nr:pseudouridine synthase [Alkalispirillum mobile]RLK48826.1 ribosomal large subunit pseudouridine synthase B [Alkalispirillum mobile]
MSETTDTEKLQKVLARAGVGSRRQMEAWIAEGRVKVNGKPAQLGDRVSAEDRLQVDGRPVAQHKLQPERQVLLYYKPEGEVCTRNDPEGRPTVFDNLPEAGGRWVVVGRLDLNSQGLLLFTTDGELANRLMHPSSGIEREYAVRVFGEVTDEILSTLKRGVTLEDGEAAFTSITPVVDHAALGYEIKPGNAWYHVTLREGRNREVRRLWESQGLKVSRLLRVRYGPVKLPRDLRRGHHLPLRKGQIASLCQAVGLKHEPDNDHDRRKGRKPQGRRRKKPSRRR